MIWFATLWSLVWIGLFISDLRWGKLQQVLSGYEVHYVLLMYGWILFPWALV